MSEVVGITVGHECPGKTKWVDPKKARGTVAKFRKKPVVIDAVVAAHDGSIKTLEGIMSFKEGDFIITGIKGERYPCKPDIFRATYEPVDHDAEVLLRIADEREKSGAFLEYEFLDYPKQEELKVDPLAEGKACEFCPAREILFPWAVPQTTDTLMLCRKCWEKEANMTVEEMWPLNEKAESEG